MLTKQAYLADPCRASSLPYWKACRIVPSLEIVLVHEENFAPANYPDYQDEPYFRLRHNLKATPAPQLPDGFSVCALSLSEYAVHINRCYEDIGVTESELRQFTDRPVYDAPPVDCGKRQPDRRGGRDRYCRSGPGDPRGHSGMDSGIAGIPGMWAGPLAGLRTAAAYAGPGRFRHRIRPVRQSH